MTTTQITLPGQTQSLMGNDGKLNIASDIQVTNRDLATIATAQYERNLLSQKKQLAAQLNNLEGQINKLRKERSKLLDAMARDHFSAAAEELVGHVNRLLPDAKVTSKDIDYRVDAQHCVRSLQKHASSKEQDFVHLHVSLAGLTSSVKVDTPDRVYEIYKEVDTLETQTTTTENQLIQVRRALSKMDYVSRQAEAAFTSTALASSEAGQKMLEAVSKVVDPEFTKLLT